MAREKGKTKVIGRVRCSRILSGARPWIVLTVVIAVWIAWGVFVVGRPDSKTLPEFALFGDSYGTLNALFSGMALFGVMYAVWLQRRELSLLQTKIEEERVSERIHAQPFMWFEDYLRRESPPNDGVSITINLRNHRSVATDVQNCCDHDGCTIELEPKGIILNQELVEKRSDPAGYFKFEFKSLSFDEWRDKKKGVKFNFELRYRDAYGAKQMVVLEFSGGYGRVNSVRLADGFTWDHPIAITDAE